MFYEKYAIYYLPRPEEIIVVRVLHGSRDIVSIAGDGGFVLGSK
jgi:toxin ParE1/3/4